MKSFFKNHLIIDGLQYCKWNRKLLIDVWKGGLTAIHVTLVYWENTQESYKKIKEFKKLILKNKDILCHAKKTSDILKAKKNNKVAIIFGFQNSAPIANDIFLLEDFFSKGIRFMQLTYNNQTPLGGGCFEKKDSGVTRFGYEVIKEMNRLGMVVDLSHAGKKTCLDAIKFSSKPVAISHANPSFFHQSKRNIDDDVLKELIKKDGFIGLSLYPYHLKNFSNCKIEDFCEMVVTLSKMVGINNIGIGSDLCKNWNDNVVMWMRNGKWTKNLDYGESKNKNTSWPKQPHWFQKGSDIINVFHGLSKIGMKENDIYKILGKNWFKFMKKNFG